MQRQCFFCEQTSIGYICENCIKKDIVKCSQCNTLIIRNINLSQLHLDNGNITQSNNMCRTCLYFENQEKNIDTLYSVIDTLYNQAFKNQSNLNKDIQNFIVGLASGKTLEDTQKTITTYSRNDFVLAHFLGKSMGKMCVNRNEDTLGYLLYLVSEHFKVAVNRINVICDQKLLNQLPMNTLIKDCVTDKNVLYCTFIL